MSLPVGHKLGSYEILSRIGRDVAVKICTLQFSERFEREARGVAALNHPQIGTLHGVGATIWSWSWWMAKRRPANTPSSS